MISTNEGVLSQAAGVCVLRFAVFDYKTLYIIGLAKCVTVATVLQFGLRFCIPSFKF